MDERKIERWILFTKVSIWLNVALAVGKLSMGIYSMSVFLLANALYTAGLALAKWLSLRGYKLGQKPADEGHPNGYGREEYRNFSRVGLVLALTGLAYMIYCLRMFWVSSNIYYTDIIAITIAAVTFTEIGMAVYGIVITRRIREPSITATKMTSLASALISLVLTQTAILSFTTDGDQTLNNGLFGLICGGVTVFIGSSMVIQMSRILQGKHQRGIERRLHKAIQKQKLDIAVEPLRLEDYGPKQRILYVRVSHPGFWEAESAARIALENSLSLELCRVHTGEIEE